ncbi:MAG: HD domain-containing phosphohydrolase, partial [Bacilli bacterium]
IVLALANMVESRDKNTGDHIKRTSIYVDLISSELLKEKKFPKVLNPTYQKQMVMGASLHDAGKIKISDTILNKPGKLTPEEFDIMKTHTTEGAKIIDMALEGITTDSYLSVAKEMAAYHHERYDGTGYCAHLKGNDIPLSARVMAVADVFDALVSKRSYKEPFSYEDSIKIIKEESGTHFDPVVVKAFLSVNVQNKVLELLKTKNLDLIEESNKA